MLYRWVWQISEVGSIVGRGVSDQDCRKTWTGSWVVAEVGVIVRREAGGSVEQRLDCHIVWTGFWAVVEIVVGYTFRKHG